MEANTRMLMASGIEPVDRLLGGLESGVLYLVHGETSGKSLFGVKFLIEGMKHGQNAALIIRYSPEDAVRRFARLGYDCLPDVQSGRLIILEFADDIIQQVTRLRDLAPMLRELGGLLDETRPERLVFDPITDLVISQEGEIQARAREFATWAASLRSTSLLIANGDHGEVIKSLWPVVKESFRFDLKEEGDRAVRSLSFEKSLALPPQTIEVDPARGIFLTGHSRSENVADQKDSPSAGWTDIAAELLSSDSDINPEIRSAPVEEIPIVPVALEPETRVRDSSRTENRPENSFAILESPLPSDHDPEKALFEPTPPPLRDAAIERHPEELNDWLDELIAWAISPSEEEQTAAAESKHAASSPAHVETSKTATRAEPWKEQPPKPPVKPIVPAGSSESNTRSSISRATSRTVEELLRPPDAVAHREDHPAVTGAQSKDFCVLIVDSDPASCESMARTLSEYRVETAGDGISGLAKLVALRPDLVVLDLDLPVIDGFKLLAHIRSNLEMPIIVVSGLYIRSSDRIHAAELGADHYLTKPFNVKELRQKARQLIARYRNIGEWIASGPSIEAASGGAEASGLGAEDRPKSGGAMSFLESPRPGAAETSVRQRAPSGGRRGRSSGEQFITYTEFVSRVEDSVKTGMDGGTSFSIVGCRIPNSTEDGTVNAVRLFGLIRSVVRTGDLISMNQRNDLVVLLADADATGAKSFVNRLLDRVVKDMSQEPLIWLRSFPHLEEATELGTSAKVVGDRSGGVTTELFGAAHAVPDPTEIKNAQTPQGKTHGATDPRESYINLLKNLYSSNRR